MVFLWLSCLFIYFNVIVNCLRISYIVLWSLVCILIFTTTPEHLPLLSYTTNFCSSVKTNKPKQENKKKIIRFFCYSYALGYENTQWILDDLPVAIPIKKAKHPSPRTHPLPIVLHLWLGIDACIPVPCWSFICLELLRELLKLIIY